ncbi:unnamed protein product [Closterium sp. Naga37s-1]|nr:unnamed protein product [Closterium sp. Naga37s-1]
MRTGSESVEADQSPSSVHSSVLAPDEQALRFSPPSSLTNSSSSSSALTTPFSSPPMPAKGSPSPHTVVNVLGPSGADPLKSLSLANYSQNVLSFHHIAYTVRRRGSSSFSCLSRAGVESNSSKSSSSRSASAASGERLDAAENEKSTQAYRCILNDISGFARSSEVTAIVGPSGSGKTTLLDVLAHRIAAATATAAPSGSQQSRQAIPSASAAAAGCGRTGHIELDSVPMTSNMMRRVSAYVMQDDLMHPTLTARETLMFSAEMNLPSRLFSRREKEARVERLLEILGLSHVANTIIGDENRRGVSGGERKRVAIGAHIVHDPKILFLDEPTSGLDSTNACRVVNILHDIAVQSHSIVVMVLHQPSFRILELVDRIMLLSAGNAVFFGAPRRMPAFFAEFGRPVPQFANPTEYALELLDRLGATPTGLDELHAFAQEWLRGKCFAIAEAANGDGSKNDETCESGDTRESSGSNDSSSALLPATTADTATSRPVPPRTAPAAIPEEGLAIDSDASGDADGSAPHEQVAADVAGADDAVVGGGVGGAPPSRSPSSKVVSAPPSRWTSVFKKESRQRQEEQLKKKQQQCVVESNYKGTRRYANSWPRELWILLRRAALIITRNPALYGLRLGLLTVAGLLLSSLFWQPPHTPKGLWERLAYLSFIVAVLFFCSADATPIFIEDRHIFIRETSHNTYRTSTYVVAHALVYMPLQILMALVITLESWWCVGLSGGASGFFFMALLCFGCLFAGNAIATFCSAFFSSIILAYAVVISCMAYFTIISGFYIPRTSIPPFWIWLHYLSPIKYAYEAMVLNEFDSHITPTPSPSPPPLLPQMHPRTYGTRIYTSPHSYFPSLLSFPPSLVPLPLRPHHLSCPLCPPREDTACYFRLNQMENVAAIRSYVNVTRAEAALDVFLPGILMPGVRITEDSCLLYGQRIYSDLLDISQLTKWQCLAVLFSMALAVRFAYFCVLVGIYKSKRK